MRERLDCAVISTLCSARWAGLVPQAGGRLHFHTLDDTVDPTDPDACRVLANAAMRLRRFDACLIPISGSNLGWARTCLSAAQAGVVTPVVGLVDNLKAAALDDLYGLGMADFIRAPACLDELRARIERLLDGRPYPAPAAARLAEPLESRSDYHMQARQAGSASEEAMCAGILERTGMELEAYAIASASRCATSRESFRRAKSQIIERFERAYITAALGRHSGNIAMAARAAQKHRRAFWALMRKHQIDATPFRLESINSPRDG
jgi:DNA-binding NtrC family response regulator